MFITTNTIQEQWLKKMIIFLDDSSANLMEAHFQKYKAKISQEMFLFNNIEQIRYFVGKIETNTNVPLVLVAECHKLDAKYRTSIEAIRKIFNGLIIAKVSDYECGKSLRESKLVDEFYLEDEDIDKEVLRLNNAISASKLSKRIKSNINTLKNCLLEMNK